MEKQSQELGIKYEDSNKQIDELIRQNNKLNLESTQLANQLAENENQFAEFAKIKQQLTSQIGEAKNATHLEELAKNGLNQQLKNLSKDYGQLRVQIDEEQAQRNEVQIQLAKVVAELHKFKSKCRCESTEFVSINLLEDAKKKLNAKLFDVEEHLLRTQTKYNDLDKVKQRLQAELDNEHALNEVANKNLNSMEKKQKNLEKIVTEWENKCDSLTGELDKANVEIAKWTGDCLRLTAEIEEHQSMNKAFMRDNQNLDKDNQELASQLSQLRMSLHEAEKLKTKTLSENEELRSSLETAQGTVYQAESKAALARIEISNVKQELNAKLTEKDEEILNIK